MKVVFLLSVLCYAAITAEQFSYDGYKVFQVYPTTEKELQIIRDLNMNESLDFWTEPRIIGLPTTVMVTPDTLTTFTKVLDSASISYEVLIENIESAIERERHLQSIRPKTDKGRISFTEYHQYNEIQEYLLELGANYPDIVTLEDFAISYEGRTLTLIKIGSGGSDKPVIFVEGGIHAREWISPAFILYLIQELVENEANRNLIENIDWYIVPVLNPDGYQYTYTNNRLWRKTRSSGSLLCRGVDGNRNFDFHWMEGGASSSQCSDTYAGPRPFSESETDGLREVVERYQNQIKLYLSVHSYGNYLLYPWGFTSDLPDDVEELHDLATQVTDAIASVSGTRYTIGSTTNVLYIATGGSDDWAKGVGGIELSYTLELPGGGIWGFDLPPSRILDVCIETFEGFKVFQSYIEQKFTRKN